MPAPDLRSFAHALNGSQSDQGAVLDLVADASFVLLGEGSHGTHDFYHERAEITKRLITEKGFSAVAIEADWPDAYRVNRYVRGESDDRDPRFFVDLRNGARNSALLSKPRLERAIGVIYRPETERVSHYFRADMPRQFDGVYHLDETRALEPLEKPERWHDIEPPETYPSGI